MFTGDGSGDFLFPALYRAGFVSNVGSWSPDGVRGPVSRDDGLTLTDMYITAVCRCAPPGNKPLPHEMANCQPYLERELALLQPKIIVVLGRIAFESILRIYALPRAGYAFAHNAVFAFAANPSATNLPTWLVCSYHPSQQNTLTGKLTVAMFDALWQKVNDLRAAL
jgi:uracil-DNA glycosylase family 4